MFVFNLAILGGVIYLLRRPEPHDLMVTVPPTRVLTPAAKKTLTLVTVYVSGAVNRTGAVELGEDARLADALQKAGLKSEADLSALDLTLPLHNGDKIVVPGTGTTAPATNSLAAGTPPPPSLAPVEQNLRVNLNTATLQELDSLPGIGPVLAQRILDYRAQHGAFGTIEDIKEVKGIGDKLFSEIQERITVQ